MEAKGVSVLFRTRNGGDEPADMTTGEPIAWTPGSAIARATRPGVVGSGERGWLVELEVDLRETNLDPEDWLRNCHGFLVDSESGDDMGVVDDVEYAPGSDRVVNVIVASGMLGRHVQTIAAADVQAILPGEQRLVVKDAVAGSPVDELRPT